MSDHLNFSKILTNIDVDQMLGPDIDRRYLRIHQVDYNLSSGTTRLVLRGILPEELRERRIPPLIALQNERERLRKLFAA